MLCLYFRVILDDDKWSIRNSVWQHIEENDLANFPRPVKNRIPNVLVIWTDLALFFLTVYSACASVNNTSYVVHTNLPKLANNIFIC